MMEKLVALCFELRNVTHLAHLKSQSYSEHMALGSFYEGIVPAVDTIVESYQGRHGLIGAVPKFKIDADKPILEVIKQSRAWIDKNRGEVSSESEIQNDIDTLIGLFNSTIYKLTFLK